MSIDIGRLWLGMLGDSAPLPGLGGPPWPVLPPPIHGDVGLDRSSEARRVGTGVCPSTGLKTCGDAEPIPRSSSCAWCILRPSKCDRNDDTGFMEPASVPSSRFSAMVISHS